MNPPQPGQPKQQPSGRAIGEETPISKYLANLEKRKSIFHPRFTPPKVGTGVGGVAMRLNFNDDTFFGGNADQSLLQSSPTEPVRLLPSGSSVFKRKRQSFLMQEDNDENDPEILRNKISDLEKLLRQTQAELIDARTSCTKLEQSHITTKKSYTEKLINCDSLESEAKIKCRNADEKVLLLENQLDVSRKRESELSCRLRQEKEESITKLAKIDQKISELQKENFELKQKLQEEAIKSEEALRKLQSEYAETEKGAEKWIMDSQIFQDQLSLAQTQLKKCQGEFKLAQVDAIKYQEMKMRYENNFSVNINEKGVENSEIQELENRIRKFENLYIKEQSSAQEMSKLLEKTKAENSILRSTIRSEMILHEQITSLETQLSFLRKESADKGKIEADRTAVRNELSLFKDIIAKLDYNSTTPLAFEASLRKTQNLLLELKHENSGLKISLENITRDSNNIRSEVGGLRDEVNSLKNENDKLSTDMKKISKRMFLLVKDRDGLKDLKESYEKEFDGLISEPLKQRISNLEEIVAEYEVILNDNKKSCPECEEKNKQLETLKAELENTQRLNETLSQTLSAPDVTTGVKIVSLANNPSMLSVEARLKECLKENEDLRDKIRTFEDNTLLAPQSDSEKKKLEEDYGTLERKHEILTETYNYETAQLQQACTKLFGFYVTLAREPQSQIRLQSVYSNCHDDIFIFQEAENSDMMLLETPILEHFRDDIDRFLMREGSIPSFLASVTITYGQENTSQPGSSQGPLSIAPSIEQSSQERGTTELLDRTIREVDSEEEELDEVEEEEPEEEDEGDDEPDDDDDPDDEDNDDDSDDEDDVIMID